MSAFHHIASVAHYEPVREPAPFRTPCITLRDACFLMGMPDSRHKWRLRVQSAFAAVLVTIQLRIEKSWRAGTLCHVEIEGLPGQAMQIKNVNDDAGLSVRHFMRNSF